MALYLGNRRISATTIPNKTVTIDNELSTTSENPIQNKVITNALNNKADVNIWVGSIQYVYNQESLATGTYTIDLSSYLPVGSAQYEVLFNFLAFGTYNMVLNTGAINSVAQIYCSTNGKFSHQRLIPVSSSKSMTLYVYEAFSNLTMMAVGYRKLG